MTLKDLLRRKGENQETRWYDNTDNLYPIPYSEPEISSYSIRLTYSAMDDLLG